MKVLVIGQGAREHSLIRALKFSTTVTEVHALPGREGFALDEAICHDIEPHQFEEVLRVVQQTQISCVIIGPEGPLADGLSDFLRQKNISVVGPSQQAAQLESSKIYAKKFMTEFNIPTSRYHEVESVSETLNAALSFNPPYVLKVDGLAAGKGVLICETMDELKKAATDVFEDLRFKEAGKKAILEDFQRGWEMSYIVLTNGENYEPLPISQDHKRLLDNDQGPNTGGMGVVGPLPVDKKILEQIRTQVLQPTMEGLKKRGLVYRGALYVGLMITSEGPRVIEYNVRFGDPEAQIIFPLLDGDWGHTFMQLAQGSLVPLRWKPLSAACVVMAAENYPETPKKGVVIKGDILHESPSSYFLHGGTGKNKQGEWITQGGRVLNAVGIGSSLQEATKNAYEQAKQAYWQGQQMRSDIGRKVL